MKEEKLFTAIPYDKTVFVSNVLTVEEAKEKERNIDKKIQKINKKIDSKSAKIKALEEKIKELEKGKWKYKIGDKVLYDGWRIVKIEDYVNRDEHCPYDYKVIPLTAYEIESKDCYDQALYCLVSEEDLSEYDSHEYRGILFNKVLELNSKLDRLKISR